MDKLLKIFLVTKYLRRTRSLLREVLLNPIASTYCRSGRRLPVLSIRSYQAKGSVVGRRPRRVRRCILAHRTAANSISSTLLQHPEEIPEPHGTTKGQDVYFEVLELQPIKLAISFMRTERVSGEEK